MRAAAALFLACLGSSAHGAGQSAFQFLQIDVPARAAGLGGAYTALAIDSYALLYNPAGLAAVDGREVSFTDNVYVEGVTQQVAAFASEEGWGVLLNRLGFGQIERTTISNPDETLGTFGGSDISIGLGYGRPVGIGASVGASVKYLREAIDDVSASGIAFDLGVLYAPRRIQGLKLGAAIMHLGPRVKFQKRREPLPMTVRLGGAYRFIRWRRAHLVAFDFVRPRAEGIDIALGLESVIAGPVLGRFGVSTRSDAGPGISGGVGWRQPNFGLGYTFVPFGALGATHRFSLEFRWKGASPFKRRRIERAELPETPEGRLKRAKVFLARKRWREAEVEFEIGLAIAAKDDPLRAEMFERRAFAAYRVGDIIRAKSLYESALREAAGRIAFNQIAAEAYAGLGRCQIAEGNLEGAREFFRKALETGPGEKTRVEIEEWLNLP